MKFCFQFMGLLILFIVIGCVEKDTRDPLLIQAETGEANAQFQWAEQLRNNKGDLEVAVEWYEKAAEQQHLPARLALMNILSGGQMGEDLVADGIRMARMLSQEGIDEAKVVYGKALLSGKGVARDVEAANRFFLELAQSRHPYGLFKEAEKTLESDDGSLKYSDKWDLQRQVENAAEAGYPEAQYYLGMLLEEEEDLEDSDKWFLEAARQGHARAMYKTGMAYRRLGDHPSFAPIAFDYLFKAVKAGVKEAIYPLAHSYYRGIGTITNQERGIELLEVGAALGQFEAVEFLLKSAYLDKDWDRVEQVRASALMRLVEGLDTKMLMALRSNIDLVDSLYLQEVDYQLEKFALTARKYRSQFDSSIPPLTEGEIQKLGTPFSARYGEHAPLYQIAAEERDGESMFELGKLCLDPNLSFSNPEEAFYWFDGAVKEGYGQAGFWVYQQYLAEETELFTEERAMRSLRNACETDHAEAKVAYAEELISGERLSRDYEEAIRFLWEANRMGYDRARSVAKDLIRQGKGIVPRINFNYRGPRRLSVNRRVISDLGEAVSEFMGGLPPVFVWDIVKELADEGLPRFQFLWWESELKQRESREGISSFVPVQRMLGQVSSQSRNVAELTRYRPSPNLRNILEKTRESTRVEELDEEALSGTEQIKSLADSQLPEALMAVSGWKLFGFYGPQDVKGAVAIWEKLATAEEGSPEGKHLWGYALYKGFQCRKDVIEGVRFIREAAESGEEYARKLFSDLDGKQNNISFPEKVYRAVSLRETEYMEELAVHFRNNSDYPKEYADEQFWHWISESAKKGSIPALRLIGAAYFNGEGLEQNHLRGIRYLEEAAKMGDMDSQYDVGVIYTMGKEVQKDINKARRYLKMAAEQGHVKAATLVTTLESVSEDSGVDGSAFRIAVMSSALNQDFFPLRPLVVVNGQAMPVINVSSKYPAYLDSKGQKTAKKDDKVLYYAAGSFSEGKITVPTLSYTAPILRTENGWIFTGQEPSITVRCQSEKPIEDVYFLLVIKNLGGSINYHWRSLGDMRANREYRKWIALEDRFFDGDDFALYFFTKGKELITDNRRQLQYFIEDGIQAFTMARSEYLEGREGKTLPPLLYETIPIHRFGDLTYPKGFDANFIISDLGFVSDLDIPDHLNAEARERFFEVLGKLRFYPHIKDGKPAWSRIQMEIN